MKATHPNQRLDGANRRLLIVALLFGWVVSPFYSFINCDASDTPTANPASTSAPNTAESQRIATLIEKLGDADFQTREKAQSDLKRLGLSAFDALLDAIQHNDIEIARRARYLIKVVPIKWANDSDPLQIRSILQNYPNIPAVYRRSHIDKLAQLPTRTAIGPLCRIAHYEMEPILAKHAAVIVMQLPISDSDKSDIQTIIKQELGSSHRVSAIWLTNFCATLDSPVDSLSFWNNVAKDEQSLFAQFPDRTDIQIVRNLNRWYADLLIRCGRNPEALSVMRRGFDVLRPENEDLLEMCLWLANRKQWTLVEELAQRFNNRFDDSIELLYMLAEAQLRQNKSEVADITASHAREFDEATDHLRMAVALQERGLLNWAELEYRRVMELSHLGEKDDIDARQFLSELLHDQGKDLPAGEVLRAMFEPSDKDPKISESLKRTLENNALRARMNYFFAQHYSQSGDLANERKYLDTAFKTDPAELDVLIARYRLPDADQAWRDETIAAIRKVSKTLYDNVDKLEKQPQINSIPDDVAVRRELAKNCNEFAWLISNTEGDYDLALKFSKRSVEVATPSSRSIYLDTLGRCYYAKGDLDNAIKYQSEAVSLDPHSGSMQRQLKFFEKTRDEQRSK